MSSETEKMYLVTQLVSFPDASEIQKVAEDWLSLAQIISQPTTYYLNDEGNKREFVSGELKTQIAQLTNAKEEDTLLAIDAPEIEFSLHVFGGHVRERLLIQRSTYDQFEGIILDYVNQKMKGYGLYAYLRDFEEFLSHNVYDLEDRAEEQLTFPAELPKMLTEAGETVVDCSQLAGYDSYFKGLCFTSAWKMWFSSFYFALIPRQAFLDVQQVDSVVELSQDLLVITLYQGPSQWCHPTNLASQLLFRDQLGFDQLEWNNGVGVLREPLAEFIRINEKTQMIQYQNNYFQPTKKSQATHFTTRLFDYQRDYYHETRRFGRLTTRAFFPWQDAEKKIMLAYWILNPSQMLDEGVSALLFYIRQYVDIPVAEQEKKDYRAILRFYLPTNSLRVVPLNKITSQLRGEDLKVKPLKKKKAAFIIQSAERKLLIEFLDTKKLEAASEEKIKEEQTKSLLSE